MPVLTRTGATVVETEPVVDGRLRYQLLNGSGPSTGWVTVQVSCRTFVGQMARTPRAWHPKYPKCFTWFQTKTAALMSSCWMVLDDLEPFWIHICHLDIGFSTFVADVRLAKAQGKELMRRATGQSLVTTVPEKPGGNEPSVNKSLFHGWSSLQEDHKGRLKRRWPRVRIAKSLWPLAFKLSHGDTSHFPVPFAFKDAYQREKDSNSGIGRPGFALRPLHFRIAAFTQLTRWRPAILLDDRFGHDK